MATDPKLVTMAGGQRPAVADESAWKPDKPLLLTQQQVAQLLNVSERTIRRLIKSRKLPVKFIGRRCLVPTAAVEKFARQTAPA
jgi:excisionase family DNA binding protein